MTRRRSLCCKELMAASAAASTTAGCTPNKRMAMKIKRCRNRCGRQAEIEHISHQVRQIAEHERGNQACGKSSQALERGVIKDDPAALFVLQGIDGGVSSGQYHCRMHTE